VLHSVVIQNHKPEAVYSQTRTVLDRILSGHASQKEWNPACLDGITPSTLNQVKEAGWAPYYIPYGCEGDSLGLVKINLKLIDSICIDLDWLELGPRPATNWWLPEQVWHKLWIKQTHGKHDVPNTNEWDAVFLCRAGGTHLIDDYWFINPNRLAWMWSTKIKCDDNFQELQDDSRLRLDVQHVLRPPFAVTGLTG